MNEPFLLRLQVMESNNATEKSENENVKNYSDAFRVIQSTRCNYLEEIFFII